MFLFDCSRIYDVIVEALRPTSPRHQTALAKTQQIRGGSILSSKLPRLRIVVLTLTRARCSHSAGIGRTGTIIVIDILIDIINRQGERAGLGQVGRLC